MRRHTQRDEEGWQAEEGWQIHWRLHKTRPYRRAASRTTRPIPLSGASVRQTHAEPALQTQTLAGNSI